MIERFKTYLEREFRAVAPTKEALEYREECLSTLIDKAQEYRIKGMTDEDAIYELCIDSLGDIKAALLLREEEKETEKKVKKKLSIGTIYTVAIFLFITAGYLIASFITSLWAKTWLIEVGGIFISLIVAACFGIAKAERKNKHIITRLLCALIITLASVFVFLILQILFKLPYSYFTFLIMAVLILFADTTIAYATKSKIFFLSLLAFVETAAALLYVMLGITKVLPWHPFWLMPTLAGILDVALLICFIVIKKKQKLVAVHREYTDMTNEELYSHWEKRPEDKTSRTK